MSCPSQSSLGSRCWGRSTVCFLQVPGMPSSDVHKHTVSALHNLSRVHPSLPFIRRHTEVQRCDEDDNCLRCRCLPLHASTSACVHYSILVAMIMTEDEGVLPRWASSVNWIRLAVVEAGLTAEELPSMPALHATLATVGKPRSSIGKLVCISSIKALRVKQL